MTVQNDFRELLALFNVHHVEFLVVGGDALAHHGAPRFTGDLDLYVKPSAENAGRILQALKDFGFGSLNLTLEDFQGPDKIVQLGVPPVRVDITTAIDGVPWDAAWRGKEPGQYGGVPIFFLGRGGRSGSSADVPRPRAVPVRRRLATFFRPKTQGDQPPINAEEPTPRHEGVTQAAGRPVECLAEPKGIHPGRIATA